MTPLYEQEIPNPLSDIPEFTVRADLNDDVAVIAVGGDFDSYFCHFFTRAVEALHTHYDDFSSARIDLQNVNFIDGTAIKAIEHTTNNFKDSNKAVHIYKPSEVVKRLLVITKLVDSIEIIDDDDASPS